MTGETGLPGRDLQGRASGDDRAAYGGGGRPPFRLIGRSDFGPGKFRGFPDVPRVPWWAVFVAVRLRACRWTHAHAEIFTTCRSRDGRFAGAIFNPSMTPTSGPKPHEPTFSVPRAIFDPALVDRHGECSFVDRSPAPGDAPVGHQSNHVPSPPTRRRNVRRPERHASPSPEHASATGDESTHQRP